MRNVLISLVLLFAFAGCDFFSSAGGIFKRSGTKSAKTASAKSEAQDMRHKITVAQPKESAASSHFTAGPDGVAATVSPGAQVTIDSDTRKSASATEDGSASELIASENERKAGLPWGVYLAVIVLVAGGVFVAFRFSVAWGVPLIAGGALVYAIFTAPAGVVAIALGAACVIAVVAYVYHAHSVTATAADAASKADALSAIKRAVDSTEANVKEDLKAAMKKVLGDKENPVRQAVDNEISKA